MSFVLSLKKSARKALFSIRKSGRRLGRLFISAPKDPKEIPIIINNFNRLSYPKQLISQLETWGYKNIIILDNNSSYPPLLDYYKEVKHEVIRLSENKGYMALWNSDVFDRFKRSYYVYTDPDVLPLQGCGDQFLGAMVATLEKYPEIEKLGLALSISDLPDRYSFKEQVIALEKEYWQKKVAADIYDAPVDTTFALYRPLAHGNADQCKAYRLNGKYGAQHLPWYEDSAHPSDEEQYYRTHVSKNSSYWMNLEKK